MRFLVCLVLLPTLVHAEPISPRAATPPVAKKAPHFEALHGDKLLDNYFWLRDKKSPEVMAYLEAENAYADAVMKPTRKLQEKLYQEMLGRIKQTDLSVPYRRGAYWYYTRTEEGKQYPIYCRKPGSLDGKEQVLLDVNELARGKPFLGVGAFAVSDDGTLLAYTIDDTGFREYTLSIKDLRGLKAPASVVKKVAGLEWAADNKTIFYVIEDHAKRPYRVYRHRLGTSEHDLIYEEKDALYPLRLTRTPDREYVLICSESSTTTEVRVVSCRKPEEAPRLLAPRHEGHEYYVDHRADRFYFLSNKKAKNFRVVTAPDDAPDKWTDLVTHDAKAPVSSIHLFENHLVLSDRVDGLPSFRVLDLKTGKAERVTFPEPVYEVAPEENPEFHTTLFRFSYQSLTTPKRIYELDLATGAKKLLKKQELPSGYDPDAYVSERVFAPTSDGARIPISLLYAKTVKRDGANPTLLYGYGAYGLPQPAGFNANRLSLLDRGVVFAIAHVRGGGEYGPLWHDGGKMLTKRNSFTDFIACADHLVKEKITRRDRLVIQGRSAGGLLIGGVLTLRPDVAKAALLEVPFVDAVNSMLDLDMPLVIQEFLEWGNPRKEEQYRYMKSYCPYTNLKAQAYPSMLLTTAFNDSQVMYFEPAKYTAKLRSLKTDDNPLLFKTSLAAGHGGASGRYDYLREQAFIYAFMLNQMGIEE
ncbi:MAG: S9 family peptidase [Gemmataceae bacterium]